VSKIKGPAFGGEGQEQMSWETMCGETVCCPLSASFLSGFLSACNRLRFGDRSLQKAQGGDAVFSGGADTMQGEGVGAGGWSSGERTLLNGWTCDEGQAAAGMQSISWRCLFRSSARDASPDLPLPAAQQSQGFVGPQGSV